MSSHVLTGLTGRRAFSSGGASPTDFIGRCDPVPFESDDWTQMDCWIRFPVCAHSDGVHAFLDVCVPCGTESVTLSETETSRLLCHVLIQHLPSAAFREAVKTLS